MRILLEGHLTDEDKVDLVAQRGSHLFLIVRKMMADEYRKVAEQMVTCSTNDDLRAAQGQLRGISQTYNLLLHHSAPAEKEAPKKRGGTLPNGKHLDNLKL